MIRSNTTRCDNCKHWDKPNDDWMDWRQLFGLCKRVHHPTFVEKIVEKELGEKIWYVAGGYELIRKKEDSLMKMEMAYVNDSSDYKAELNTRADFFCAYFEEK